MSFLFYLFIYESTESSLPHGLSLVAVSRGYSLLSCSGYSLWGLLLLWSTGSGQVGSVVAAHRLLHGM